MSETRRVSISSPVVIGRALRSTSDRPSLLTNLYLANNHISKFHAVVYKENDAVYVKDTDSTFGTILNNVLIGPQEPHLLKHGDTLGLVVNRTAAVVRSWREKTLLPTNIPLRKLLNPWVHLQFDVGLSEDVLTLTPKNKLADEACLVVESGEAAEVTRTPEYEDGHGDVVSEDEPPEEVKFVKEVVEREEPEAQAEKVEAREDADSEAGEDADSEAESEVKSAADPEPELEVVELEDESTAKPEETLEPDVIEAVVDEPEPEPKAEAEAEPYEYYDGSSNDDITLDEASSDAEGCEDFSECCATGKGSEIRLVNGEWECVEDSDEDLAVMFGWNDISLSEVESDYEPMSDQGEPDTSLSDAAEPCCGVKRSFDVMTETDPVPATALETPIPERPLKKATYTVLKEVGKGALYVVGTVVALIAYGRSLENQ